MKEKKHILNISHKLWWLHPKELAPVNGHGEFRGQRSWGVYMLGLSVSVGIRVRMWVGSRMELMRAKDGDKMEYTPFNVNIPRSIHIPFINPESNPKPTPGPRSSLEGLDVGDVKPIP